jgi:hypothetical protein
MEVKLHSFLILALDRGEWSASHSGIYLEGKGPKYPLKAAKWAPGQSGYFREEKNILSLLGFESWIVEPVG